MTSTSSATLTSPASATSIILFGEILVDCFPDREVAGGAPFNVARNLRGLGHAARLDPVLVTRIGKDERGNRLLELMQSTGLATEGVQHDSLHPTGQVRISQNSETKTHQFEIVPEQAWDFIHADTARMIGLLHRPQWIYFGTLAQRGESRRALRSLLLDTSAQCFLDINLRAPWIHKDILRWSLGRADVVKLNDEELAFIANMFGLQGATPQALGEDLLKTYEIRQLLVTEGAKGAWVIDAEQGYFHTREQGAPIKVVDTVGAGDAFSSVFLLGLTQGWPIQDTLDRAHRFAGEVCQLRGAVPDSGQFYQPFIKEWLTMPISFKTCNLLQHSTTITTSRNTCDA